LVDYNYKVAHKAGKFNVNVDALSRNPVPNIVLPVSISYIKTTNNIYNLEVSSDQIPRNSISTNDEKYGNEKELHKQKLYDDFHQRIMRYFHEELRLKRESIVINSDHGVAIEATNESRKASGASLVEISESFVDQMNNLIFS